jgi:hypothetical protein
VIDTLGGVPSTPYGFLNRKASSRIDYFARCHRASPVDSGPTEYRCFVCRVEGRQDAGLVFRGQLQLEKHADKMHFDYDADQARKRLGEYLKLERGKLEATAVKVTADLLDEQRKPEQYSSSERMCAK